MLLCILYIDIVKKCTFLLRKEKFLIFIRQRTNFCWKI